MMCMWLTNSNGRADAGLRTKAALVRLRSRQNTYLETIMSKPLTNSNELSEAIS